MEKRQMEFPLFPQLGNDQAGRGASGEIMAVNKTLGIIYHLLAEKCRRESIIYIITYIILGLNSATMISSIK